MIDVVAMYEEKSTEDHFDMEYLVEKRIPFVKEVLRPYGLTGIVVHEGIAAVPGGGKPKYRCVIVLSFRTREGFEEGFRVESVRMNKGISEFTNIEPVVMITQVASS